MLHAVERAVARDAQVAHAGEDSSGGPAGAREPLSAGDGGAVVVAPNVVVQYQPSIESAL